MPLQNTPLLKTERLILRQFTQNDLQAVYEIFSDEKTNEYLPFFPVKTIEEAQTFLKENYLDSYSRGISYKYAICLKTDNIPIGYLVLTTSKDSYDFGYGLKSQFWHQGIASEAASALIKQLKNDGLPFITATHDINNPNSGKVMKRIGMKYQYSYIESWQPKNKIVTFRMYQMNLNQNAKEIYMGYWNQYPDHFIEKIED